MTPNTGGEVSSDGPVPRGAHEGETSLELDARVERLRRRQRDLGTLSMSDATACEEVCSLATSICGVQEKLCNIADEHPQEDDYQALCREAKLECQAAQQACVACVERHTTQPARR